MEHKNLTILLVISIISGLYSFERIELSDQQYENDKLLNIYHFHNCYAQDLKLENVSYDFIDEHLIEMDSVKNGCPGDCISIGARGIKRHKGFSVVEVEPYFIRNDSLFQIEEIEFEFTDFEYFNSYRNNKGFEKIDMLIITNEQFADNFYRFKKFKSKQGIRTQIVKVEDIYPVYPGENNVIRIRNYIKEKYYQNDVEYVLIGGGYKTIPVGKAYPYVSTYTSYISTDAFYSNLDGGMDTNGNGIYMEYQDNSDCYADVCVGRLPGNSEQDIDAMINKHIRYYSENRDFRDGFNTSSFLIGTDVWNNRDGEGWCEYVNANIPDNFTTDSLYEHSTPDFCREACVSGLEKGYNFMYCQAHGDLHLIRQKDNNWKVWSDTFSNLKGLSGLYFIASCHPGEIGSISLSQKAMINPYGGCVAYVGSSANEYSSTTIKMNENFFSNISEWKTLGESLANSILSLGNLSYNGVPRYMAMAYAIQGDPSMRFFLKEPLDINIADMGEFRKGSGSVSGSFNTMPNDSLIISLVADDELVSTKKICSKDFNISYDNLNSDSVYIYYYSPECFLKGYGYSVSESELVEIEVSDIKLDDENSSGILEENENSGLSFSMKTISNNSKVENIIAKIKNIDSPYINLLSDSAMIYIPAAGDSSMAEIFGFTYSNTDSVAPDSVYTCDLILEMQDGRELFRQNILIPVSVPYLEVHSFSVDSGFIDAKIINKRKGSITKAEIQLVDTNYTNYGTVILRNINGYEIVTDSVKFQVDPGQVYKFAITVNDNKTYETRELMLIQQELGEISFFTDYSLDKINLEWMHSYPDDIKCNVYKSENQNFENPALLNNEPLTGSTFSFYDDMTDPVFTRISLVNENGQEFKNSEVKRISFIPLYKNKMYKVSEYQLYNPVYVNRRLISNSQNSSISGIEWYGAGINHDGVLHKADINGFSGTAQQGFAVGDVNADGTLDMVNYSFNNVDSCLMKVVDLENGELIASKRIYGFIMENAPVLVNSDEDPELEILIATFNGNIDGEPKGSYIYLYDYSQGSLQLKENYPIIDYDGRYHVHSPSLLDLDGDGSNELVYDSGKKVMIANPETAEIITEYELNTFINTSLSFYDIDSNGKFEIYAITDAVKDSLGSFGRLYCFEYDGTALFEKPVVAGGMKLEMKEPSFYDLSPPVSFADFDNDSIPEIIALTASELYVFNSTFDNYGDFPVQLDPRISSNHSSAPSIADFNGDGILDILFMDANYRIWCYSGPDGKLLTGFPIKIEDIDRWEMTAPAVADLNNDGTYEFAVGADDGVMIVYDYPEMSKNRPILDKYRGDLCNSGIYDPFPPIVIEDEDPVITEFILYQNYPNPFNPSTTISFYIPEDYSEVKIEVFNVKGEKVRTLSNEVKSKGIHSLRYEPEDLNSGLYYYILTYNGNRKSARKMLYLK